MEAVKLIRFGCAGVFSREVRTAGSLLRRIARTAAGPLRRFACTVAVLSVAAFVGAQPITFVPKSDPTGSIFSVNSNDLYGSGRGIIFQMTGNTSINSVGIFLNVTNTTVTWEVARVMAPTGYVGFDVTVLRSGSSMANTTGLQFVDFNFTDLALVGGNNYHINFKFNGNAAQNFFYLNNNATWTQGMYTALDGTLAHNTANTVVPAIRVNSVNASATPEAPAAALVFWGGLIRMGMFGRRAATHHHRL